MIILIDEYDVPLHSAFENHYYEEMIKFLRSVFSQVLKSNDFLEKAILSGCLRISKESIFTGLNNFSVNSITSSKSSSAFGFTQKEVDRLYSFYGFQEKLALVKEWYDGYRFGSADIYNPWSVLLYLRELQANAQARPVSYWANTSSNSIVMSFIKNNAANGKTEFQQLIQGGILRKQIKLDLTFQELENPANIYSFLLVTGYLKPAEPFTDGFANLQIPNREVREIYISHFLNFFEERKASIQPKLFNALISQDPAEAEKYLNDLLFQSVSFFDNVEAFYHGFLTGILSDYGYHIISNREAGTGRFDLVIHSAINNRNLILIECRHSKSPSEMEKDAAAGAEQIRRKKYLEDPAFAGFLQKHAYSIAFHKKMCLVRAV